MSVSLRDRSDGPAEGRATVALLLVSIGLALAGCAPPPVARSVHAGADGPGDPGFEHDPHWPLSPLRAERLLRAAPIRFESLVYAGAGLTGASRGLARFEGYDEPLLVKWKPMPGDLDGINNSPRREIATYQLQARFLEPDDWVVPTTVARCVPHAAFPGADAQARGCRLGTLALWLRDLEVPARLHDPERFARDRLYATYLANFNVLSYLALHRDGRSGNFLTSRDERRRRVFAVDNGITFSGFFYNWFVDNWDEIKVAALPRALVGRLREIEEDDLESLAVVAELVPSEDGLLRSVPPSECWDEERGVRRRERDGAIQLGLTEREIEAIEERLEALLEAVDEGRLDVF